MGAKPVVETHHISSVLLGLEGTAPQCKSPFGVGHDSSGASAKISAVGSRKWRAYRRNNAFQIPSDFGGIRVKITERSFQELRETMHKLDLCDVGMDMVVERGEKIDREVLDRKYAEQELFKQVLSSNAAQARRAMERMKEYRENHKTYNHMFQKVSSTSPGTWDIPVMSAKLAAASVPRVLRSSR